MEEEEGYNKAQGGALDRTSRVVVESGPRGFPPVGGAGPPSSGRGLSHVGVCTTRMVHFF